MSNKEPTLSLPFAFVIGLDSITGLQTARLLAQRGVPVIGIARDPDHFACRTNVCHKIIISDTKDEDLITTLEKMGPELGQKAVLVPCTDMSVLFISKNQQRLENWYRFILPPADVVETLMNKVTFYEYAQRNGLPVPGTFFLKNRADAEQAAQRLTFPCILKPPLKTKTWESNSKSKVYKLDSSAELLETYDTCSQWADLLMVQEWIPGPDSELYSCNCYYDAQSRPLVNFIAQKLRQWPPQAGTSCLGVECRNDEVLETSLRLFNGVSYQGLGHLEMKHDPRTGKYYMIEANIGRPTGRSAISEGGGVELVYTMYCDLAGLPLPENRVQKYTGVKWIYLRRDIQSALYYWRRGELTIKEWWESWRGRKVYADLSFSDPAPFLFDFFHSVGIALRIRKRRYKIGTSGEKPEFSADPVPTNARSSTQ